MFDAHPNEDIITRSYISKTVCAKEVNEDKKRFSLMNRYVTKLETKERETLLLNQLIIVFNTFKFAWACLLMEINAKDDVSLEKFYAIMYELGFDTSGCEVSKEFLETFRRILSENRQQEEILRSFQRGNWW